MEGGLEPGCHSVANGGARRVAGHPLQDGVEAREEAWRLFLQEFFLDGVGMSLSNKELGLTFSLERLALTSEAKSPYSERVWR